MCHSPSAHTRAWSFTPASGSLRIGLRSWAQAALGAGPGPLSTHSWSAPSVAAGEVEVRGADDGGVEGPDRFPPQPASDRATTASEPTTAAALTTRGATPSPDRDGG